MLSGVGVIDLEVILWTGLRNAVQSLSVLISIDVRGTRQHADYPLFMLMLVGYISLVLRMLTKWF